MSTTIQDIKGGMSNCCGAAMYIDLGICSDCKEHCEAIDDECPLKGRMGQCREGQCIHEDRAFSHDQLKEIAAIEKKWLVAVSCG